MVSIEQFRDQKADVGARPVSRQDGVTIVDRGGDFVRLFGVIGRGEQVIFVTGTIERKDRLLGIVDRQNVVVNHLLLFQRIEIES